VSAPLLLELPWSGRGLGGFTSTRQGGLSSAPFDSLNLGLNTLDSPARVLENRRAAMERAALDARRVVHLQQVHGSGLVEASAEDAGRGAQSWDQALPACDAVFTRVRGLPLAVGHADCLAVALGDPQAGLVGLAHAGWRGALAGLPKALALRLLAEGASPRGLQAVLSPCLGPASLELGEQEHQRFTQAFARHSDFCTALSKGHFYLDLWTCVRQQLLEAGLEAQRIQGQELDTALHPELFFSHRRDQGHTGRMLTVVVLN
jgi:YfiH family protein